MSSILRSLGHVRKLNISGRRLGSSSSSTARSLLYISGEQSLLAVVRPVPQCLNVLHVDNRSRAYVTNVAAKQNYNSAATVDFMLNELDRKIKIYGSIYRTDVDDVLQAVLEKGVMTTTQALLLIRCCGEFISSESLPKRQELVKNVWEITKSLDVPLDVSHYNALLLVNLENETNFSPLDILLEMKKKNIEPNRVTFQRLIEQFCNKGDIAGATKILEHMSQHDIPLNETIFNSLIKGHSEAGDLESAVKVLDLMKQAGIEPSSRTYTAIMCAHAKLGNMEAIREVLNKCKTQDILFTDREILDVIYTLAIKNQIEHIDEMMSCLPKEKFYNRDAVTTICKLVEKNQLEVGYKLVKSLTKNTKDIDKSESGGFFIKKLVTNDVSADKIINYIKRMEEENLNHSGYKIAVLTAFKNNSHHLALPLLKAWKESGGEIREHFFYPIFVSFSKANNLQGILNTIRTMIFDFNIMPSIMTIRHYVVPYMVEDPINNALNLNNNNLPFSIGANAILLDLLLDNKTHQAAKFVNSTSLSFRKSLILNPLVNAFIATKDVKSIAEILHHQYVCMLNDERSSEEESPDEEPKEFDINNGKQLASAILTKIAKKQSCDTNVIIDLLYELLNKGVSIDSKAVETLKERLGDKISPEIDGILSKLQSDDLTPSPIKLSGNVMRPSANFRTKRIEELEEKAQTSPEFKMQLLQHYTKLRNHSTVEKLLKELEEENAQYTVGVCASLVDYYSKENNIQEADKWFKRLFEIDTNSKIDKAKLLNYATALIKNNRASEALQVLHCPLNDPESERNIKCEKFMNDLYQYCPDKIEDFFNALKNNKFIQEPSNSILGPVIKSHIEAGNLDKAIDKLQWASETYRLTPQKNVLMMKLIQNEDAKALQRVTDILTQIHGEMNALFDLAISFFECNRPRQARKILETPGMRINKGRVIVYCNNLNNRTDKLENLIQLLQGLYYDMDTIYLALLKAYEYNGEWSKCLALWTQMQEDNIQPSPTFMMTLEKILRDNDQNVPFARSETVLELEHDEVAQNFHDALVSRNFSLAEAVLEKLPQSDRAPYLARLTDIYVSEKNKNKALEILNTLIEKNPSQSEVYRSAASNVFKFLAEEDDFEAIKKLIAKISSHIRTTQRRNITFSQSIIEGYINTGNFSKYIDYLEQMLLDSNIEKSFVFNFVHPLTATKALVAEPELVEKFKKFANLALENKMHSPINSLWIYQFLRNDPEAEQIWQQHLKDSNNFYVFSVAYACEQHEALDKLPKVAEKIQQATKLRLEEKRKGFAMIFRILLESDEPKKYELAYECMRYAVKALPYHLINDETISTIEENLPNGLTVKSLKDESSESVKEEATG